MASHQDQSPVVLVTGAARRIGAVISRKFHSQGFNVIIHYNQSAKDAQQLAAELNVIREHSAKVIQADLQDWQQVSNMAKQALDCFGIVDVLVNNASGFFPTPLGTVTSSQWEELMNSNLKAAFFLSQGLVESLRERKGAIVNLIDIYAEKPLKNYSAYCIAKAGLKAMTRSLALELAPFVRVNGVSPGAIIWPNNPPGVASNENKNEIIKLIPLGQTGSPDDIAEAVFFIAAKATYMTGEVLRVDGGRSLNL